MYLVMEFCGGGELSDTLKERVTYGEDDAQKIMARLASAVAYLHKNGNIDQSIYII